MVRFYWMVMLLVPLFAHAQVDSVFKGIKFESGMSWEEIMEKAKLEHKNIFVDYFATWCGPCREMDRTTYMDERVGEFVNSKLISVKVQMDSTAKDPDAVRQWYSQAQYIRQQYKINELPSFLIFSSEGQILHMDCGYKNVEEFISFVSQSSDPNRQYFALLRDFRRGGISSLNMPYLAETAKRFHDDSLADSIAAAYFVNYLSKSDKKELYIKRNVEFLGTFLQHSSDKWFWLFYHNPRMIDSVMGKRNYAQWVVDNIIYREEILPKLFKNKKPITEAPNWIGIMRNIRSKYSDDYADRTVLNAKIRWYTYKKDWTKAVRYNVQKIDRYGLDTAGIGKIYLSDMIYSVIFMHSADKRVINKSLLWMQVILHALPGDAASMDTYANLLYKIGRTDEALAIEERAAKITPSSEIQQNLLKMKKKEPTWSTN